MAKQILLVEDELRYLICDIRGKGYTEYVPKTTKLGVISSQQAIRAYAKITTNKAFQQKKLASKQQKNVAFVLQTYQNNRFDTPVKSTLHHLRKVTLSNWLSTLQQDQTALQKIAQLLKQSNFFSPLPPACPPLFEKTKSWSDFYAHMTKILHHPNPNAWKLGYALILQFNKNMHQA